MVLADSFLQEFDEYSKLADGLFAEINERNRLVAAGQDASKLTATIRRKLSQLSTKISMLEDELDSVSSRPSAAHISDKELLRRQDMLRNLKNHANNLNSLFHSGPKDESSRPFLDTRSSAWGSMENDATRDRDNMGLLQLQDDRVKKQDDKLGQISDVVRQQREIAGLIGDEVDEHIRLLTDMDPKVDRTTKRVQVENQRVLSLKEKAATGGFWVVICLLFIVIIILIIV